MRPSAWLPRDRLIGRGSRIRFIRRRDLLKVEVDEPKMKMRPLVANLKLIITSCILGAGTLYLASYLNYLPYSPARDWVTDALAMPGGLVGWVFYPGGVHDGHALRWAKVVVISNGLFYSSVWFFGVKLWRQNKSAKRKKLVSQLMSFRPLLVDGGDGGYLNLFDEFMRETEFGSALDLVCDFMLEPDSPKIDAASIDRVEALHTAMEMEDDCVEKLRREKLA